MTGYVWRDPARVSRLRPARTFLARPLTPEAFRRLTPAQVAARRVQWARMIEELAAAHTPAGRFQALAAATADIGLPGSTAGRGRRA